MKVTHAPVFEILDIKLSKGFKPPKKLSYQILVKRIRSNKNEENDELHIRDLIALTDKRPRYGADLNRPNFPYTIASVEGEQIVDDEVKYFTILSSNPIVLENINGERGSKRMKLFSVHLTNLNTNIRIWNALNWEGANINIIQNLLQSDSSVSINIHW